MCKNSDYVLLLRSNQFYPALYALQISTMRIRCYVILNTTNCFIKHQCTNETTISVYRSDTKTETQIGRYFADTVTRDGTRNSSSLDPRGPRPFFTPRFPEE